MKIIAIVILSIAGFVDAKSCEYCFVSQHGYIFALNQTSVRLDVRYQYWDGLTGTSSDIDRIQAYYISTFVTFSYATERWGFNLAVPYVRRMHQNTFVGSKSLHYQHIGRAVTALDSSSIEQNSASGIGDATLLGRYALLLGEDDEFYSVYMQGGVKFPTGAIDARDKYGYLLHPHLQVGTGTGMILLGATGSYGDFKKSISGNLLAGIPLPTSHLFQEAFSVNYDVTYQSRILPHEADDGPILVGIAGLLGKVSGKERYQGSPLDASGGHYMFFSGGFSFLPVPELRIDLLFQAPLIKALAPGQLDEQFRLVSGFLLVL